MVKGLMMLQIIKRLSMVMCLLLLVVLPINASKCEDCCNIQLQDSVFCKNLCETSSSYSDYDQQVNTLCNEKLDANISSLVEEYKLDMANIEQWEKPAVEVKNEKTSISIFDKIFWVLVVYILFKLIYTLFCFISIWRKKRRIVWKIVWSFVILIWGIFGAIIYLLFGWWSGKDTSKPDAPVFVDSTPKPPEYVKPPKYEGN
jgi:hypothetical protein